MENNYERLETENTKSHGKLRYIFKRKEKIFFGVLGFIILAVIAGAFIIKVNKPKDNQPQIISESFLYKAITVSDLNTYQCVYNDICTVRDTENPEKVLYHCAYEAKITAGIDVSNIKPNIDEENKKVTVTIPKVEIKSINVDISTLDYMFEDNSANTNTVSEEAYKACIADADKKGKEETEIYSLAEQNAKNIVKAITVPLFEPEKGYQIFVVTEGEEQ